MRVLLFCLGLGALAGCARDEITLGSEATNTGGGNNTGANAAGADEDAGTGGDNAGNSSSDAASNNSGGEPDAGGSTGGQCTPAMCAAPIADLGELDASDETSSLMEQGAGHAFVTLTAVDGNSQGLSGFNGILGIKATLTAPAGTYEVHIVGDLSAVSNACTANASAGSAEEVTAIWNGMGPVAAAPDKRLSVEVRPLTAACDGAWTLTVTGLPCMSPTVIGASCP